MSTEIKKKKKRGSHDNNKLIMLLAIALGVIVVAVSVLSIVLFASGNYVAKLNGQKLYKYEYTYYLNKQLTDAQNEVQVEEGADDTARQAAYTKYFTTRGEDGKYPLARCKDQALEELRLFKTSYQLAKAAGHSLTGTEEKNVEQNVDYIISYYNQMYSQYSSTMTYEDILRQVCGNMSLKQYKEYAKEDTVITKYKEAMKKTYNITDEELRAVYDANVNEYRKVTVQKFFLSTQTTGENGLSTAMTEEQKAEVKAKIDDYLAKFTSGEYDFEEKIKLNSEESNAANTSGVATVSGSAKSGVTEVDAWAMTRTAVSPEKTYEILTAENGYYIIRCNSIEDFDNSKDSGEGTNDSIKNTIKTKLETEKADAEMRQKAESAEGYQLSSLKESRIKTLFDENISVISLIQTYGAKVSD